MSVSKSLRLDELVFEIIEKQEGKNFTDKLEKFVLRNYLNHGDPVVVDKSVLQKYRKLSDRASKEKNVLQICEKIDKLICSLPYEKS